MKRLFLALAGVVIIVLAIVVARQFNAATMHLIVGVLIGGASAGVAGLAVGYAMGRQESQPARPTTVHNEYHMHQERTLYMQAPPRFGPATGREIVRRGDD